MASIARACNAGNGLCPGADSPGQRRPLLLAQPEAPHSTTLQRHNCMAVMDSDMDVPVLCHELEQAQGDVVGKHVPVSVYVRGRVWGHAVAQAEALHGHALQWQACTGRMMRPTSREVGRAVTLVHGLLPGCQ